jgi:glucose-6-phosphate isomerase
MRYAYFDDNFITDQTLKIGLKKIAKYRSDVKVVGEKNDNSVPEYSLFHVKQPVLHDTITKLSKQFKGIKHLVLIGIGGSSLGTEAVHEVLGTKQVTLHTLDTISAHATQQVLTQLQALRSAKSLAIVVISKSGGTTETLVNAGVFFGELEKRFGADIYQQVIFISDPDAPLQSVGKRLKATTVTMPKIVGGRYSVTTEVGLIPLALLGHDVDRFMNGILDATTEEFESVVAENAVRLHSYITKNYRHYNFFAFDPRLASLGAWYRQLTAESLGKATDRDGKVVTKGFLPTISTPTELHSIGQLYLSGFSGVYTDFVTFDDSEIDFKIPKKDLAKAFGKFTMQEVATGIYGGVISAYQEKQLPYRSVIFDTDTAYDLGLFMAMRMLETMYIAELMNLNAFDQPNVELYKIKTKEILGL